MLKAARGSDFISLKQSSQTVVRYVRTNTIKIAKGTREPQAIGHVAQVILTTFIFIITSRSDHVQEMIS